MKTETILTVCTTLNLMYKYLCFLMFFGNLCFDQLNKAPGAQISDVSEDLSDFCVDKAHLGLFEHGPLFQPDGGGCFTVDSFTELIISDLSFSTLQHPIKIH